MCRSLMQPDGSCESDIAAYKDRLPIAYTEGTAAGEPVEEVRSQLTQLNLGVALQVRSQERAG